METTKKRLSMKQMFGHHHRPSEPERHSLWSDCIFALDANVLLNIYRYADSTRKDLFQVLDGLKGRIWVPYQAAKEFYKNRIEVIRDQNSKYRDLEKELEGTLNGLRGGKFSKSAFLRIENIEAILKPAIEEAKTEISKLREKHPDLLHEDPYLEKIASIIGTSIGKEPETQDFEDACIRAKDRIDKKQPPGYADDKKPTPDRYGDVLVWFELLEHARSTKKPIVFVTDDGKEDWWQIIGGQKLGPRPELREEMYKESGMEFYLTEPANFLSRVSSQLKVLVSKSSVDDAQKIADEIREQLQLKEIITETKSRENHRRIFSTHEHAAYSHAAEEAIFKWTMRHYPGVLRKRHLTGRYDFTLQTTLGLSIGVDTLAVRHASPQQTLSRVQERFLRAHFEIGQGVIGDFWLFLVAQTEELAEQLARAHSRRQIEPSYTLSIGYLSSNGEYK